MFFWIFYYRYFYDNTIKRKNEKKKLKHSTNNIKINKYNLKTLFAFHIKCFAYLINSIDTYYIYI